MCWYRVGTILNLSTCKLEYWHTASFFLNSQDLMVRVYPARWNISILPTSCVYMFRIWFPQQTTFISLYSGYRIFCQMPAHCAVCQGRTDYLLCTAHVNWRLKWANSIWSSLTLWPTPCFVKLPVLITANKPLGLLAQFRTVQYKTGLYHSVVLLPCRLSIITYSVEIVFTTQHPVTIEDSEFFKLCLYVIICLLKRT